MCAYLFSFSKNQRLLAFDAMNIAEVVIANSEMPTGTWSQQFIAQIFGKGAILKGKATKKKKNGTSK